MGQLTTQGIATELTLMCHMLHLSHAFLELHRKSLHQVLLFLIFEEAGHIVHLTTSSQLPTQRVREQIFHVCLMPEL